jgi:hypothetical protein
MSHQSKSPPPPLLLGAVTVKLALTAAEGPPAGVVVNALDATALLKVPDVALVTAMVNVQLPLAGMVAPASDMLLDAAASDPPQVVAGAGELLTVRPLGSVSVKATLDKANVFELFRVIVSVDTTFSATLEGEKASLNVAATGAVTVSVAETAAALPPAGPVISAFTGMMFLYAAAAALETPKVTLQVPRAGMIAPAKLTEAEVVVKLPAPVQFVEGAGELATCTPLGRLSLKLT